MFFLKRTISFLLCAHLFCAFVLLPQFASAAEPPPIGNFSLPGAQQPGPLFSFGQFDIDQNQMQLFMNPSYIKGVRERFLTIEPSYVYGVTDNLSYLVAIPIAAYYYQAPFKSSGLADATVQAEYAFLNTSTNTRQTQATIVLAATVPTGSLRKNPATGLGSPSLFSGLTYNQMYIEWYWFVSPGLTWVVPNKNTQLGSAYTYDAGVGKNLWVYSDNSSWFGLVEFNGLYAKRNKIDGVIDQNSGGNIITISPSLIYSTEKIYTQFGVAFPIQQSWNGMQAKTNYLASFLIGWLFN